ncbi:hypothetical protein [Mycoavidus sp. B2-EB]|uniref:hypothetical protein n=1 Tax=Mycoavidus sp. B2-EB TaxID=2651972 RepID=UPI0016251025|nr:hypothetical protein [Mycoavidus sp. B2-EB]BBO59469.1 hypothetical protein MPB2EB_0588 [Mycoavidus sp. B2-EB]
MNPASGQINKTLAQHRSHPKKSIKNELASALKSNYANWFLQSLREFMNKSTNLQPFWLGLIHLKVSVLYGNPLGCLALYGKIAVLACWLFYELNL